MIHADFKGGSAAISGAYQYDTGQRIRLSGLPSPQELMEADDLLSGEMPAVQVQYAYWGDSNAQTRLAIWDEARGCWVADIPDEYLTRHAEVRVYVYVYFGAAEDSERTQTMYQGAFTPINRPAPGDKVTEEQLEQWATLQEELEVVVSRVETAAGNAESAETAAKTAATTATDAAENADTATENVEDALRALLAATGAFAGANLVVVQLAEGSAATAEFDGTTLTLGIPRGATGAQGAQGAKGPSDITMTYSSGSLTITPTT